MPGQDIVEGTSGSSTKNLTVLLDRQKHVEKFALHLVAHPLLGIGLSLGVVPVVAGLSAFDLPSMLYFFLNKPEPGLDKAILATTKTMIDVAFVVFGPTVFWLSLASLKVTALMALVRDRDKAVIDEAVKTMQGIRADADAQLSAILPMWTVLGADPAIRAQLLDLANRLEHDIAGTPNEHRIITRSLVRGLVSRFDKVAGGLSSSGAFMDPTERRSLTDELFEATASYNVIFFGVRSIRQGPWRWHDEYLKFLQSAAASQPSSVSWTFIDWDAEGLPEEKAAVMQEVAELGVPCYAFDREGRGQMPRANFENFFGDHGPLMEIFGGVLSNDQEPDRHENRIVTWKSTSLHKRTANRRHALTARDAAKIAGDEGVWAADEIDKLVRAGLIKGPGAQELHMLDQIQRNRRLIARAPAATP